jgi:hypothetical protein
MGQKFSTEFYIQIATIEPAQNSHFNTLQLYGTGKSISVCNVVSPFLNSLLQAYFHEEKRFLMFECRLRNAFAICQ